MEPASLRGKLLVATPVLGDPNFRRTVVLVLEHSPEGAVGIVLNRASETAVADPLPQWKALTADPAVVFVGGPVSRELVIGLGRRKPGTSEVGWSAVVERVGTIDLDDLDGALATVDAVRLFAGYAGWGPEQLEGEIAARAWWVVGARGGDAFSPDPAGLWAAVLRRQRGELRLLANYPLEPSHN